MLTTAICFLDTKEMYNISRGKRWVPDAHRLPRGVNLAASTLLFGRIFLSGGYSGSTSPELYELVSDGWVQRVDMNHARGLNCMVAARGHLHVIGGYDSSYLSSVEQYNPVLDQWQEVLSMPIVHSYLSSCPDASWWTS